MRVIKFRAKSLFKPEWWFGNYVYSAKEDKHYIVHEAISDSKWFVRFSHFAEVDPKTLGQFTGLTDKNGAEIYESDIVLTQNETKRLIAYENSAFHVNGEFEGKKVTHPLYYQCILKKDNKIDFEVIGNIHENPELLC